MRQVYQTANTVLSWLESDAQDPIVEVAVDLAINCFNFLFQKFKVSVHDLRTMSDTCQELITIN